MGDEKLAETSTVEFSVAQQDAFAWPKQYISPSDDRVSSTVYVISKEEREASKAQLLDSEGKLVSESDSVYFYRTNCDPRYDLVDSISMEEYYCSEYSMSFDIYKNVLEAGSYRVKLIYSDGTSTIVDDAMEVITKNTITYFGIGEDCDGTGEYLYLNMEGIGIQPEQLNYAFLYDEIEMKASYVSSKKTKDGFIAKLKKDNWAIGLCGGKEITVEVTPKSGYDILITADKRVFLDQGIFYTAYNKATGKIEAGISSVLGKGEVFAELKEDWEESSATVATATSQLNEDGLVIFEMKNPDGSTWKPASSKSYYLYCTLNGKTYNDYVYCEVVSSSYGVSVDYWSYNHQMMQGTGSNRWFNYYEGADYDKSAKYESTITGSSLQNPLKASSVESQNAEYEGVPRTRIAIKYDLSKLAQGDYTVHLTKNGKELSSCNFQVVGNNMFVLNSFSAYWEDDQTIKLYLNTPNYVKDDNNYKVTLTDPFGNEVKGLTTKLISGYESSLYLQVTGLNRLNAYKNYYVKISHNKWGDAKRSDLKTLYFDDKGELKTISLSTGGYMTSGGRVIGLNLTNAKLPAQLMVYKSYNAEEVVSKKISSVDDNNFYYFTKALYDELPDPNALYDIVVVDSGDWVMTINDINIGYKDQQIATWNYAISSTTLYVNSGDLSKATITVTGNKSKPTFKSSDSSVVKLTTSASNTNVAELEAVGLGSAEISITADGKTETITVNVTKLAILTGITFNKDKLTLAAGSQSVVLVNAMPVEAWDAEKVIDVVSSDSSIVTVEKQKTVNMEAARVALTAVKPGKATVTATLKEKEQVYTATIEVTVEAAISEEEKKAEIEKAGVIYALTNNTASLKDVKLPKGWAFIEGDEIVETDNKVQYFAAKYTREDGAGFVAKLPVAVAELKGIKIQTEGTGYLNPGKSSTYTLTYDLEGYSEIPEAAMETLSQIQWDVTKGACVTADAVNKSTITLTAKQAGTQEITATVKAGNGSYTDKANVTVMAKESVNRIVVSALQASANGLACELHGNELTVNAKDFEANKADSILLETKTFVDEKESTTGVEWKSSDDTVATVTKAGDVTTIKILKAGSAVITAVAADEGKYSYSINLSVKDYAPILDETKITLNKNLESVPVPFFEQNGNHITGVEVFEGGKKSLNYEAEVKNSVVTLKLMKVSSLRNSTKSVNAPVVFKLATQRGAYEQQADVTLDVKAISLKFKQTKKANLFYKDTEAVFTINSAYTIDKVEDTVSANEAGFHVDTFDYKKGVMTLRSNGITKDNVDDFKKSTVNLKVTLREFAGSITVPVTIQTEVKKPGLALSNTTIYNAAQAGLLTSVIDKKTKKPYVLDPVNDTVTLDAKTDKNGYGVIAADISNDGKLKLTMKGTKKASYKVSLHSNAWIQPLVLSGKVASAKQPVLMVGAKSVTLNTAHSVQSNGRYVIPVSIKDSSIGVRDVTYSIKGRKDALPKLFDYLYVGFNESKQQLEIGLNKGHEGLIAGKYTVQINGLTKGVGKAKPATFRVVITDGTVSVKLAGKGKINLADRASTSILYTPKFTNVSAKVEQVELTGNNAYAFEAVVAEDSKIEVKAVPDARLKTNANYALGMILTLDNDCEVETSVVIKPANKLPKVKATVTKGTLYKVSAQGILTDLAVTQKSSENFIIDKVKLVADGTSENFKVAYLPEGKVKISLSDKASELAPGKYVVKYNVYFKDAATDGKPVTLKMAVTVK